MPVTNSIPVTVVIAAGAFSVEHHVHDLGLGTRCNAFGLVVPVSDVRLFVRDEVRITGDVDTVQEERRHMAIVVDDYDYSPQFVPTSLSGCYGYVLESAQSLQLLTEHCPLDSRGQREPQRLERSPFASAQIRCHDAQCFGPEFQRGED
jgi:hypothetical protein